MAAALKILAGEVALKRIREDGLQPAMISHFPAAAGGPKWLILGQLDRYLFGDWFAGQQKPVIGIGASAGAWRLACLAQADPAAAIDRFEAAYVEQHYASRPTAAEVSREGQRILAAIMQGCDAQQLLAHPWLRINLIAARCRALSGHHNSGLKALGLGAAVLLNSLHRRALALSFERLICHHPDGPVTLRADGFKNHYLPLAQDNLLPALNASAAIPRVMETVAAIPGAPSGPYMDGGMIDYHMDLPLAEPRGLALMPHFSSRVISGWLDKFLPRRRARFLQHTVLLCPSDEFIAQLPGAHVPDRQDFLRYENDDAARLRAWRTAISASRALADEFQDCVERQRYAELAEPLG